jgi:YegS/Rv2252/BmrU family lipid kinase
MNYTIIINPTAGRGISLSKIEYIKNKIEIEGHTANLEITKYEGHAKLLVKEVMSEETIIIVAGGDGTIRECIIGLMQCARKNPIAILPIGTGNDFARTLGIDLNMENALKIILMDRRQKIHFGQSSDDEFINVISTGFDAAIVKTRNKLKKIIKGPLSYLISTLLTLVVYKAKVYQIEIDGVKTQGEFFLIAVANGKYYGGGMKVAPHASPNNEKLDICMIKKINKWRLLTLLPTIYSGKHIETPYVDYLSCDKIKISCGQEKILVNIDGELVNRNNLHVSKNKDFICEVLV